MASSEAAQYVWYVTRTAAMVVAAAKSNVVASAYFNNISLKYLHK